VLIVLVDKDILIFEVDNCLYFRKQRKWKNCFHNQSNLIVFLTLFFFGVQIVDPKLASYGVENPLYSVIQVAQNTARSELSKIILDKFFMERNTLYEKIVVSLV